MKQEFEFSGNTIVPTKENFAYLAGLIDAECCLGIQKYNSENRPNSLYKIQLQCNNTKAPIFKWLLERFGGQIHFIDRKTKDFSQRNQLTWRLTSRALADILHQIYPFLKYKKTVCKELIKFNETSLPNGGDRQSENFKILYSKIIKKRERIVRRVHDLNQKGNK